MSMSALLLSGCLDPEHEILGKSEAPQEQPADGGDAGDQPIQPVTSETDTDGDGVVDIFDLDSDNDGIPDAYESCSIDTDNDGIANCRDIDSDNDGISDLFEVWYNYYLDQGLSPIEATAAVNAMDTDNDGMIDVNLADNNNDNRADGVDIDGLAIANEDFPDIQSVFPYRGQSDNPLTANPSIYDTDNDGTADMYDLDADGDGVPDVVENGGTDNNQDGISDDPNVLAPVMDADADGTPNYLDLTSYGDERGYDIDNIEYERYTSGTLDIDPRPDGDGIIDDLTDADGDGIADIIDGNTNRYGHGAGPKRAPTPKIQGGGDGIAVLSVDQTETTTLVNIRYQCQLIEYAGTDLSDTPKPNLEASLDTDGDDDKGNTYHTFTESNSDFVGRVSCGGTNNDVIFFIGGETNNTSKLEENQKRLYLGRISAEKLIAKEGEQDQYILAPITPELLLADAVPELETLADPSTHPAVINLKRLIKSLDVGEADSPKEYWTAASEPDQDFLSSESILVANVAHETVQLQGFTNTTVNNQKGTRETFADEVGEFFSNTAEFEAFAESFISAVQANIDAKTDPTEFVFAEDIHYVIDEGNNTLAADGVLIPASQVP
ncbi:MAG: hypothetical protein SVC26_02900 [Pseudomonadota bacterium]|nr:hypothetical protein [Pseudomonadota bacterium]